MSVDSILQHSYIWPSYIRTVHSTYLALGIWAGLILARQGVFVTRRLQSMICAMLLGVFDISRRLASAKGQPFPWDTQGNKWTLHLEKAYITVLPCLILSYWPIKYVPTQHFTEMHWQANAFIRCTSTVLSPILAHAPVSECAPLLEYRRTEVNCNIYI